MDKNKTFPHFYDGSSHAEFSEELVGESPDILQDQPGRAVEADEPQEWRKHVGANPFNGTGKT
ncbi:hypothetical protein [Paenibacillus thalictri]|uniref:Uncharacterized protein n=1 Tax=Paenibacillus thalictri TaxID=2527873 RepID=A0A4Q9DIX2_9BACL|nr:hypothetical protein [Paenibacillus thalictri]TBL73352.1 hypothetical protein EYB31_27125 [Paenibacillus thalictri]